MVQFHPVLPSYPTSSIGVPAIPARFSSYSISGMNIRGLNSPMLHPGMATYILCIMLILDINNNSLYYANFRY
uniref:Ovule protein n=1 Tax=Heterorhabditis bacteriophora TaxID=37862 RepID=A0A1I7WTK5_HETBA